MPLTALFQLNWAARKKTDLKGTNNSLKESSEQMCIHGNSSTRNNNTCKRHTWRATHISMHTTGTQVRACVSATGFQYGIRIMRGRDERAWFLLVHTHSTGMRAMLEKSEYESIHSRERTNERSLYEFSSSWNVEDVGRYFNLLCRQPRSIPSEKIEFFVSVKKSNTSILIRKRKKISHQVHSTKNYYYTWNIR